MTVIELINQLKDMPHNAQVLVEDGNAVGIFGLPEKFRQPVPEMEWNDHAESYLVVL